jgi:hypothetical protein
MQQAGPDFEELTTLWPDTTIDVTIARVGAISCLGKTGGRPVGILVVLLGILPEPRRKLDNGDLLWGSGDPMAEALLEVARQSPLGQNSLRAASRATGRATAEDERHA